MPDHVSFNFAEYIIDVHERGRSLIDDFNNPRDLLAFLEWVARNTIEHDGPGRCAIDAVAIVQDGLHGALADIASNTISDLTLLRAFRAGMAFQRKSDKRS